MKTINMEVGVDLVKQVLLIMEQDMASKIKSRNDLSLEISALEDQTKILRSKIQDAGGTPDRAPTGDNQSRIKEYLGKIPGNTGARPADIQKATGIGTSSVAFTLKNYKDTFVQEGKLWKLKI